MQFYCIYRYILYIIANFYIFCIFIYKTVDFSFSFCYYIVINLIYTQKGRLRMKEKVILAYSGGLDTSVSIKWLTDEGYDVVACCLDIGEGKDTEFIKEKALQVGAVASYAIDAKEEFAQEYALIALQGHTFYEQSYPLVSALSRPLIAKN